MHNLNTTVLSREAVVMNIVCHRAATAFSGTSSVVHQPVSTHTSGVPAESVSHNTALAKAVRMALTCIHHKPPAWEGMSRGALPGCCVSTRRRASAGHGWTTWRSDHWGENERC